MLIFWCNYDCYCLDLASPQEQCRIVNLSNPFKESLLRAYNDPCIYHLKNPHYGHTVTLVFIMFFVLDLFTKTARNSPHKRSPMLTP